MRPNRILTTAAAGACVLSLGAGLAGSVAAVPLPRHDLKVDAKELDSANRFVLYGKVDTLPDGTISVVRSVAGGPYHRVKKLHTSGSGRFRSRIYQVGQKLTCFKVIVPASPTHRRTVSKGAPCIASS